MKRLRCLLFLTLSLLPAAVRGQDVVVNEYLNATGATGESIELLVLTDKLDLRGYTVQDFTGTGNVAGLTTFANIPFWESVRSGYVIVLLLGSTPTADTDFSDGVVQIGRGDGTYFSATGITSIAAGVDAVEVLDAGGAHVHALGHNPLNDNTALDAALAPPNVGASVVAGGSLGSGDRVRFVNTDAVSDFDDDAAVEVSTAATQGAPNDAVQEAFKARLLPLWINEVQVDGGGTIDAGEFVEIVGPAGFSILNYTVLVSDCAAPTPTEATYPIDDGANGTTRSTLADEQNGFGFYVLSDPSVAVNDQDLNQPVFTGAGQSNEDLPDALVAATTSGAVVLRDAGGHTVFEFAYGLCMDYLNRLAAGVSDSSPGLSEGFALDAKPGDAALAEKLTATPGAPNGDGQVLPVELIAFDAVRDGAAVLLRWATASETNNAGFEVQHRPEAGEAAPASIADAGWQRLAFVDGHGTTLVPHAYTYRVAALPAGHHRFRLKQIDYDGTTAYSPEVTVAVALAEAFSLSLAFPNPFREATTFSFAVARTQRVRVAVYDGRGRRVAVLHDAPLPGGAARLLRFEADGLPSGLYVIRAEGASFATQRLVVRVR